MAYSKQQLERLWIQAGGPPQVAEQMARIALRESGGRAHINNAGLNKNGSVDYGLWQINSVHGYNPQKLYNPLYNAKAAVAVYKKQGPRAWATYNPSIDAKYIGKTPSAATPAKASKPAKPDFASLLPLLLGGVGGGGGGDPLESLALTLAAQRNSAAAATPSTPATPSAPGRQSGSYPLGKRGRVIGTPYSGTHAKDFNVRGGSDNWQSENAVDVRIPVGTPVYAEESGTLGNTGSLGQGGRFSGLRTNLIGKSNSYYYAHLSKLAPGIRAGARVKKGQLLGYSGEANGVPHLHFAVERGDPRNYVR